MLETKALSLRDAYRDIGLEILDRGRSVSPRGRSTVELAPATLSFEDPLDTLPTGVGRGIVVPLAAVEALSLIAGEADPALFVAASPHYANFVDPDTGNLDVAYGPRIGVQMEWAELRLRRDDASRQAHVDFWRMTDLPGLRAYPCVTSCGFQLRDDELECYVEMRSNDFWLGLPYDAFAFGQLQATLANVLKVTVGWYHHYARSLHIYTDAGDDQKVRDLARPAPESHRLPYSGVNASTMFEAQQRASELLRGNSLPSMTDSEFAYLTVMREKVLPKVTR